MNERWERSSHNSNWKKRLPYEQCPHCGEYSYTTSKRGFYHRYSPDAGRIESIKIGEIRLEICDNCELIENKRLKIWISKFNLLSPRDLEDWDRDTTLNGFSQVEIVPKPELRLSSETEPRGDSG